MSIIDRHANDSDRYHAGCGGTILMGPNTDDGHQYYCDRCGAFRYGDGPMPTGTDEAANREAYDAGDLESPSMLSEREMYEYAVAHQDYSGTLEDWLAMPTQEREEYEHGAAGEPTE